MMEPRRPPRLLALVGGGVLLCAAIAAALFAIMRAPCFQLVGDVVCRVETERRVVALSFDDGPTPAGVDFILPLLSERGIHATFFVIGNQIEQHPGQIRRLAAAGHEVGNHSFSHQRMVFKPAVFYAAELARTNALLRREGAEPRLFRPPFGKRLTGLPPAVERAGLRMVTWDIDDGIGRPPTPTAYADHILSRVRPGSIILIHPMYRHNDVERAALPAILDGLRARGYRVVPVGTLLREEGAS